METNQFHAKTLFTKVLTGNISPEEKLDFEKWVKQSEENKSLFQDYQKIWQSASVIKEYDIEKAKLKTQIKINEKLKSNRGFFYYWQKIAAVLLIPIIVASAYFIFKNYDQPSKFVENIETPLSARTSFQLPDGSVVWLNSGTEVSYPNRFGKIREITLNGEAYFEIKKGKRPFVVKTVYGDVKVYGTKFNVFAFDDEPFKTTLVEGSVGIKDKLNNKEILLKPGFQYTAKKGFNSIEKVDTELHTSWKDGKLIFRREPFESVAKRLERWYNVTIILKGDAIKNLWYTGTIEMESFIEVMDLIKNCTPIDYSYDTKNRILTITTKNINKMKQN